MKQLINYINHFFSMLHSVIFSDEQQSKFYEGYTWGERMITQEKVSIEFLQRHLDREIKFGTYDDHGRGVRAYLNDIIPIPVKYVDMGKAKLYLNEPMTVEVDTHHTPAPETHHTPAPETEYPELISSKHKYTQHKPALTYHGEPVILPGPVMGEVNKFVKEYDEMMEEHNYAQHKPTEYDADGLPINFEDAQVEVHGVPVPDYFTKTSEENPMNPGWPGDGSCAYCGEKEWNYRLGVCVCNYCGNVG